MIIDLLNSQSKLFLGIELSVHIICVAAVKVSVESVVESLVSRFERHFDKCRQLDEENALMEMDVAENGPTLSRADGVLRIAMNKCWAEHNSHGKGKCHFIRTSSTNRLKDFDSEQGKSTARMMKEKSKFPFQDL